MLQYQLKIICHTVLSCRAITMSICIQLPYTALWGQLRYVFLHTDDNLNPIHPFRSHKSNRGAPCQSFDLTPTEHGLCFAFNARNLSSLYRETDYTIALRDSVHEMDLGIEFPLGSGDAFKMVVKLDAQTARQGNINYSLCKRNKKADLILQAQE